ncbi:hypothetical protein BB934_23865 [Microvirga ossetica]|uniref:DUF6894 domain-containing protein n=1 Tax=Microvirga ossetica TaxID=1882682 RepID=A0A1B2EM32_9HYPH|nr:hypothetical protein [Microvirga ossetica]ANY80892.1 hypothetical protein BB934_23865 [Microvirga ossetica]
MPRFYFDLLLGSHANRDEEGHSIDSLQAAEIEAMRTAGELARDRLLAMQEATPEDIQVTVRNEERQQVLTVTVSIRINRMEECHGLG